MLQFLVHTSMHLCFERNAFSFNHWHVQSRINIFAYTSCTSPFSTTYILVIAAENRCRPRTADLRIIATKVEYLDGLLRSVPWRWESHWANPSRSSCNWSSYIVVILFCSSLHWKTLQTLSPLIWNSIFKNTSKTKKWSWHAHCFLNLLHYFSL
jgi:hypothetical protein